MDVLEEKIQSLNATIEQQMKEVRQRDLIIQSRDEEIGQHLSKIKDLEAEI